MKIWISRLIYTPVYSFINLFRKGLDENKVVGLSQILVCLEDAKLDGAQLAGQFMQGYIFFILQK